MNARENACFLLLVKLLFIVKLLLQLNVDCCIQTRKRNPENSTKHIEATTLEMSEFRFFEIENRKFSIVQTVWLVFSDYIQQTERIIELSSTIKLEHAIHNQQ